MKRPTVPRSSGDPIRHLTSRGWTIPALAVEWRLKSTLAVTNLRDFANMPRYTTAARMSETFGWSSGGEVMDFWATRVETKRS